MAKTYSLIQAQTLTSTAASITFSNVPQNFTDLVLKVSARGASNFNPRNFYLNFNSDTGNNYPFKSLYGNGSSVGSSNSTSEGFTNTAWVGYIPGNTATASTFGNIEIYIPNYAGSAYKFIGSDSVTENNATTAYVSLHAAIWNSTSAITSIQITCSNSENFATNSTFYLYGVGGTRATGGTITSDKDFTYHTFTSTSTFTALEKIKNAEVLQIAGGGGGGSRRGGGGGAGGLVYGLAQTFFAGTAYTCIVGAGGAGGTGGVGGGTVNNGVQGTTSQFYSLTSSVGGGGGTGDGEATASTLNGGSGGGSTGAYAGGTATSGQGFAGGAGSGAAPNYGAGGGGGAGGAGVAGNFGGNGQGGNGGTGTNAYHYWHLATGTGVVSNGTYYIAGGGGGGVYSGGTGGAAGLGGGGAAGAGGGNNNAGIAGTANTGGGGGGSSIGTSGTAAAGAGGSGIVIIRYPNY